MEPMRKAKAPLGQYGPFVDETNMNFFGEGKVRHDNVFALPLAGPAVVIDPQTIRMPKREPVVDMGAGSARWKVLSYSGGRVGARDVLGSMAMHVLLVGLAVGVSLFSNSSARLLSEEVPVEVSFGFGFEPHKTEVAPDDAKTEAPKEALKTAQQLPQLTKNTAIEATAPDKKSMPLPEPAPVQPKKETKIENSPQQEPPQKIQAKIDRTPPPGAKTVTPEEYLRRLERENRKVGEKETKGTQVNPEAGKKQAKNEIPPDPFAAKSVPDAPPGLGPSGSLEGQRVNASVKNEYAASATSHIRKFWSLPDVEQFEANLQVVVSFQINPFGRILGKIKVDKSSGNNTFDDEAVKAVEAAVPFPELPEELLPRVPIRMKFSPQDIKM